MTEAWQPKVPNKNTSNGGITIPYKLLQQRLPKRKLSHLLAACDTNADRMPHDFGDVRRTGDFLWEEGNIAD